MLENKEENLGNLKMHFWLSYSSHISSVTMMGLPVEVYTYGTQYLIVVVVNVLVIVITMYVFLPVFYELQLTSVYKVCTISKPYSEDRVL